MCGRYASFRQAQDLADIFDVTVVEEDVADVEPSWNVAPTNGVRVILERLVETAADAPATGTAGADGTASTDGTAGTDGTDGTQPRREMHVARWGLLPHWAKQRSAGAKMINTRVETVATKFTNPLRTKRCLVPVDGYFEWQVQPGGAAKQPYFIEAADGAPLAFAGLYSWWRDPAARANGQDVPWLLTCSILTTASTGAMTRLHDRVPVVLGAESVSAWLDTSLTTPDEALAVLGSPAPALTWHPVATTVNAVRNNGPELIEPVA